MACQHACEVVEKAGKKELALVCTGECDGGICVPRVVKTEKYLKGKLLDPQLQQDYDEIREYSACVCAPPQEGERFYLPPDKCETGLLKIRKLHAPVGEREQWVEQFKIWCWPGCTSEPFRSCRPIKILETHEAKPDESFGGSAFDPVESVRVTQWRCECRRLYTFF